jgi:chromosome segregation ATPase
MILRTDSVVREGRVVDVRDLSLGAAAILEAIRTPTADLPDNHPVAIEAPDPNPVHERVGHLRPGMGLRTRTALAAAARSRGLRAPQDDEIERVESELAALDLERVEQVPARRKAAETADETARLRERVAELRGRIQERRAQDADTDDLEAELVEAVRELSEAETELVAASQRLTGTAETAREARDVRERRLRLQDRKANRERAARAHLVETFADEYAEAVASVPRREEGDGGAGDGQPADPFAVDGLTAALAVARIADLSAPVVCRCDRFETPAAAAEWLGAPVVRL